MLTGVGAAGVAVTDILLHAGARRIIGCDHEGAVYRGRPDLTPVKEAYAERTNPDGERGTADDVLAGADVFIGLSAPGAITRDGVARMTPSAIVFAMANPDTRGGARGDRRTSSRSSPRAARTTRTRSTTCSRSPVSSAGRSTSGPRTSPRA